MHLAATAAARRSRCLALFCLALLLGLVPAGRVSAQTPAEAAEPTQPVASARKLPIVFAAVANPSPARAGEYVTVTVSAKIDPDWHLYAPTSASPANSPTTPSDITAFGNWQPASPTLDDSTPVRKFDANFHQEVAFHEGAASFSRTFRAEAGPAPTEISFHYQTCNSSICLPPITAKSPLTFVIGVGPVRPEFAKLSAAAAAATLEAQKSAAQAVDAAQSATDHASNAAQTAMGAAQSATNAASATSANASQNSGGWGLFLLAAAGAGLLALATPCVFPLIPITLAGFAKQAGDDKKLLARLAVGYALGVAVLYVAIGGIVSVVAGAAGANRLAANPWVNLFAFAVFVVFALSFFEAVALELPSGLTGSVQGKAKSAHSGWVRLGLLGIVFVLASFTCTAPFIGPLLVAAAGGERLRPLVGMAVFAIAFTSPFYVFAAFPQLLTKIPKSGAWLARVKATLGFVELAAALKFLSNSDLVWQWHILTRDVLLGAWALLFACAALYLLDLLRFGIIAETTSGTGKIPPLRGVFAGLFAGLTLYCFFGLSGRPLSPVLQTFLPPADYGVGGASASGKTATGDGLVWLSDYETALAQAKAEHKLLLIDFTGYTCTNCRWNEQNIFPDAGVSGELKNFVRVQLYTDGGPGADKNQDLQEKKFGDIALPLYGIVDPQTGAVVGKTAGVQTVGGFTQFLKAPSSAGDAPASGGATAQSATQPWAPYSDAALAAAKAAGKPVIVDFTAAWCVNCKEIEHDVFEEPEVAGVLSKNFVTLRGDLTKWTAPENVALQKKYGFGALPTILVLGKEGAELKAARITGRLSKAEFLKRIAPAE